MKALEQHLQDRNPTHSLIRELFRTFCIRASFVFAGSFLLSALFFYMASEANSSFAINNLCVIRWMEVETLSSGEDFYCSYRYSKIFLYGFIYALIVTGPLLAAIYGAVLGGRFFRMAFIAMTGSRAKPPTGN